MSNRALCDLCGRFLMENFQDLGYKVSVKALKHSYDGYNPWIRKTKLDICHNCMAEIISRSLDVSPPSEVPPQEKKQ